MALVLGTLLHVGVTQAQTVLPTGNQGAYANNQTGGPGSPGGGSGDSPGAGGNAPSGTPTLDLQLNGGTFLSSGGNSPTLDISVTGGVGGQGHDTNGGDNGANAGAGGQGGTPGALSLTMAEDTQVTSTTTGPAAVRVQSIGGDGGAGGTYSGTNGTSGKQGDGGNASNITLNLAGSIVSKQGGSGDAPGPSALMVVSQGGNGAPCDTTNPNACDAQRGVFDVIGEGGGAGGNGGNITLTTQTASFDAGGSGITLLSQGGIGSNGSTASDAGGPATGGNGGAGGDGGTVTATIVGSANPNAWDITAVGSPTAGKGNVINLPGNNSVETSFESAGVSAQSFGGDGGEGGEATTGEPAKGGSGGSAGSGEAVQLTVGDIRVTTTGHAAPALLAQSIGGSGGDGASAGSVFSAKGGNGATGGDGGAVTVQTYSVPGATTNAGLMEIQTSGSDSSGIVAQSIGGGGGAGGDVSTGSVITSFAIGGSGEKGGDASAVTVNNGDYIDTSVSKDVLPGAIIKTNGDRSNAITAMSVGGGGGNGGDASSVVGGALSMTVGGTGGTGGTAGIAGTTQVSATSNGIIQTSGAHAMGMQALAVGGGGGDGGSANSLQIGAQVDVSITVGGKGGTGGTAGDVYGSNDGQILTQGNDAYGMQVLSVGGGGGNGGASKAAAYQLINSDDAPSLDFSLTIGGNGGTGGNSGNVNGTSSLSIVTNGEGSDGMLVQSIGGGGGSGGDSSSTQLNTMGSNINVNVAIGGQGAAGGMAADASATNSGLIWTMDRDSDGMVAQSIGGGGGKGGVGSADTSQYQDNGGKSGQFNLAVGGNGGSGNSSGFVTAINSGSIITMGDDSRGIVAQSIGGGGGKAGGAISNGSTGQVQSKIAIGGNGGSGNFSEAVTVTNSGSIVTGGGDSAGIYAQSIGGGGGDGGNAGTGGNKKPTTQLFDYLKQSLPNTITSYNGDTTAFSSAAEAAFNQGASSLANYVKNYYAANAGSDLPSSGSGGGNFNITLNIGGGFAGKGGAGGNGLMVDVTNTGSIQTLGPMSDGIFAQSIGGGGGDGGSVTASDNSSSNPSNVNATIAIGGRGGSSGDAGLAFVTNQGSIATAGSASMGIFAASIGGGGGTGGYTSTSPSDTKAQTVNVQLGGDAGSSGSSFGVTVNDTPASSSAPQPTITTSGSYAAGIAAVSIGGGGGVATLASTLFNPATGGAVSTGGLNMSGFQMGGLDATGVCGTTAATCGNGGTVKVDAQAVQTSGQNAHGIVAQSIGGGGGWVLGGATGGANFFNGINGLSGNGQAVSVTDYQTISTAGAGAYGVIAQSVGGGGLLAGDFSSSSGSLLAFSPQSASHGIGSMGNGGDVTVNVLKGATISTTGDNAVGIFAQSVGGGGGLVASDGASYAGSAGGTGAAGSVTVQVDGQVTTTGANASAIVVNVDGTTPSSNAMQVNVTGEASSTHASAIVIDSNAASNNLSNSGVISVSPSAAGFAVNATRSGVNVDNQVTGSIVGALNLGNGVFTNAGSWSPDNISIASSFNSTGTIVLGNAQIANETFAPNTVARGNLSSTGTLASYVDFAGSQASTLVVLGNTEIGGQIAVNPVTVAPNSVMIVDASGDSLKVDSGLTVSDPNNQAFQYQYTTLGNTLSVQPVAQIASMASRVGMSRNAQQLADNLQANFEAGANALSPIYTALAQGRNDNDYRNTIVGLGTESLQMVGVARTTASEMFVNRMNACPDASDGAMDLHQRDCVWGRVSDQGTTADGSDGDSYHLNEHVVQLGGQHEFADGWWVGGSAAYNNGSESASSGVGGVTDHGFNLGAVVKREWGPWLFTGTLDVGQGSYQSSRNLQLTDQRIQAAGSFDATNIGLHSRIAYLFPGANWYVKPYLDMHAVNIHTDSFQETNVGAVGLNVGAGNGNVYSATPMVEAGGRFNFANGVELRPFIGIGEAFYSGNHWNTNMQFIGGAANVSPYNSEFNAPDHMNQVNTGLDLRLNAHSSLRLDYTGQFGNGYRMNEGALKYTYFF